MASAVSATLRSITVTRSCSLAVIVLLALPGLSADEPPDFLREVRPILAAKCFACHGADEGSREGDLRLDIPPELQPVDSIARTAVIAGNAAGSELAVRIASQDPDLRMPPPDSGRELSPQEIDTLNRWIAGGANYELHWSFRPVTRPEIPIRSPGDWGRNAIDAFVLRELKASELQPSREADPLMLVRRLSLDLTGLPPSLQDADAFAADASDQAYEALVDRLLASPRFGEHWARMWLDLARYADTKGYEKDQPRQIWRYRDWVIDAFNADTPFDRFTREQLAGDLLPDAAADQILATAFHRNTMTNDEGGTDNEEFRLIAVKDRIDTTGQVWMGLTIGCAKCHSHKYDPISQREYYELLAAFNQTEDADRPSDDPRMPSPTVEQTQQLAALDERIAELKSQTHGDEEAAVKTPQEETLKQLQVEREKLNQQIAQTPIMRELAADRQRETFIHVRGNFLDPGEKVSAAVPASFGERSNGRPATRLAVAEWLMAPENPLTARVAANRIWARLFGVGIVETEEDFGTQGAMPSHPELLDWLATEYRETHAWSLKKLLKTIVLSSTYRQTSEASDESVERDPENRLFSRGARFRLSGETVRDQALAAAGLLSMTIGGPSVMPPQPPGIWQTTYSKLKWETSAGDDRYRRGLYTFWRRTSPYPSMVTFDAGSREVCQIRRIRTNTPLQALVTMNDPVYVEAAGALAKTAIESAGRDSPEQIIEQMFRRVLVRSPSDREKGQLRNLFDAAAARFSRDPDSAVEFLAAANLKHDEAGGVQATVLAAWTVVCNVILNLDETLMRQ